MFFTLILCTMLLHGKKYKIKHSVKKLSDLRKPDSSCFIDEIYRVGFQKQFIYFSVTSKVHFPTSNVKRWFVFKLFPFLSEKKIPSESIFYFGGWGGRSKSQDFGGAGVPLFLLLFEWLPECCWWCRWAACAAAAAAIAIWCCKNRNCCHEGEGEKKLVSVDYKAMFHVGKNERKVGGKKWK